MLLLALAGCGLDDGEQAAADSRDVAEVYAAAWVSCADWDAISLDEQKKNGPSAEQLDEYADCLKEIDDDLWRRAIADRWTGSPGSLDDTALHHDLAGCERQLNR